VTGAITDTPDLGRVAAGEPTPDLEARLEAVERPLAHHLVVDDARLMARLNCTPALHRVVPTPAAVALARVRARCEWRLSPSRREQMRERARAVAAPGTKDADVEALARKVLREQCVQTELSWRPWDARRMAVHGIEHLDAARASGRGTILVNVHAGPFLNLVHAIAARGHKVYLSGGRSLDEPPLSGHDGLWTKTQNAMIEDAGCRWVRRGGSYELVEALLRRGELAWMSFDARGELVVPLLGRTVGVRSGIAQLACATGATLIPAFAVREGLGQVGLLLEPIEPGDAGPAKLTDRLARAIDTVLAPRRAEAHAVMARLLERGAPR